jgi:hypothetical protein
MLLILTKLLGCDNNGQDGAVAACPRKCPPGRYSTVGTGVCLKIKAGLFKYPVYYPYYIWDIM